MKKQIQNTIDSETPFKVIKFDEYEIRLYWTARAGMYGYQVVSVVYHIGEGLIYSDITGGCGYCKESSATEHVWRFIGKYPRHNKYLHAEIDYRYRVGGNFYRVPKKHVLKLKKRK